MMLALLLTNATLTFYSTNTILSASNIVVVGTNARITHAANPDTNAPWTTSNRVHIVCTNFTLASGASVNVDGMGYGGGPIGTTGYGPGRGPSSGTYGSGGSHGGVGGNSGGGTAATNGSEVYPFDPGSGGGGGNNTAGGAGGGAVRIEAAGRALIDGVISANGVNGTDNDGGGSGGGIYLECHTLAGAGTIRANAGRGVKTAYVGGSGGGGGRIAVRFAAAESPAIEFGASGGPPGYSAGRPGTLWLSQYNGILSETWSNGLELVTNAWSPGSVTLSSSNAVAVLREGFALNVAGDVRLLAGAEIEAQTNVTVHCAVMDLSGSSRLWLSNNVTLNCTNLLISGASLGLGPGAVADLNGSDLDVTNVTIYVREAAGFTNVNRLALEGVSTLYAYAHPTSGVLPRSWFVNHFRLAENSQINGDGGGYGGGASGMNGYGPGAGAGGIYAGGAGYGGAGGDRLGGGGGGVTNGSEEYPFDPGSGGGGGNEAPGGAGGCAVRIKACNEATINGIISVNGADCHHNSGGGAGGGVYIHCRTISGRGTIRANGGSTTTPPPQGGGGGGGRIAVRCEYNHFAGTLSVTNGTGAFNGQVGTIYWRIQGPGTVFSVR